jgi:predicted ATP-grasp superfamily ATP-dependent carboligase
VRILLAGVTTRAVAESARRAGCDILTVDLFGDVDQKRLCENTSLRERGLGWSAAAVARLARALAYDAVAYAGGFENHPAAVARLAAGRRLLGNSPETLRRVRDPGQLFPLLRRRGFAVPATIGAGEPLPAAGRWLVKPVHSGGGLGIRPWRGEPLARGRILQSYVDGTPASAAFVADGRRSVMLGWTEQLRGPGGFLYGGNVLPLEAPAPAWEEVGRLAAALTEDFALRGLNGFDFVLEDGRPVLLEVNPRYCASMELIERATGESVFGLHLAACEGRLPPAPVAPAACWGKAVVYARTRVVAGDTDAWIDRGVRDVPPPGAVMEPGQPICTVLARGATRAACMTVLRAAEEAVRFDSGVILSYQ